MQLGDRKGEKAKAVALPPAPQCAPPIASSDLATLSAVGDNRELALTLHSPFSNQAIMLTLPISGDLSCVWTPLPSSIAPVSSSPTLLLTVLF